jgi:hypothetical protein
MSAATLCVKECEKSFIHTTTATKILAQPAELVIDSLIELAGAGFAHQ